MRRRISTIAMALLVALGVIGVAATPAQAAASDCAIPRICVWDNTHFPGTPTYYWTIPATPAGGYCINYGGSLNDNVDAIVIKGGRSATLYQNANCSGETVQFVARPIYGGPEQLSCGANNGGDNWACLPGFPGELPSSMWVIRTG